MALGVITPFYRGSDEKHEFDHVFNQKRLFHCITNLYAALFCRQFQFCRFVRREDKGSIATAQGFLRLPVRFLVCLHRCQHVSG